MILTCRLINFVSKEIIRLESNCIESDICSVKIKGAKMSLHDKKVQAWIKKYGGLSFDTQKKLDRLMSKLEKNQTLNNENISKSSPSKIASNTKFIREYAGIKHEVTSLDNGFNYKGQIYKSLSAIANEITGTRWNGKRFFGVYK